MKKFTGRLFLLLAFLVFEERPADHSGPEVGAGGDGMVALEELPGDEGKAGGGPGPVGNRDVAFRGDDRVRAVGGYRPGHPFFTIPKTTCRYLI